MEYYIALRDKAPNDPAVGQRADRPAALRGDRDRAGIGREDFIEAERLRALIDKADPQAPSLPRLKPTHRQGHRPSPRSARADSRDQDRGRRQQQADAREAAPGRPAEGAAEAAAAARRAAGRRRRPPRRRPPPTSAAAAAARPPQQRRRRQRAAPSAGRRSRPRRAAPRAAGGDLRRDQHAAAGLSAGGAARRHRAARSQVEFTVNPDGSVGNARRRQRQRRAACSSATCRRR